MTSLTFSQMEGVYAGTSESDDFWHTAADLGCAVWGIGRAFLGIAIYCAASPLAGAICTGLVDAACATVTAIDANGIIAG